MLEKSGIYKIVNKINGKIYYGSTNCFRKRFNAHRHALNNNKHRNKYLQSAWNKYGENNFLFGIELVCNKSELIKIEQYYLNKYFGINCYNLLPTAGNNTGMKFTQEHKDKIGKANSNKKFTDAHRKKLSISHIGKLKGELNPGKIFKGMTWKIINGKRIWMEV